MSLRRRIIIIELNFSNVNEKTAAFQQAIAVPWINLIDHSAVTGQEQIPQIKITHFFTGKMTGAAIVRRRNDNRQNNPV